MADAIQYLDTKDVPPDAVLALYRANGWSASEKPAALCQALRNSHTLLTAWDKDQLVGLANAISDGYLVVYYPHIAILPTYQRRGIGRELMARLMSRYQGFHQQALIADKEAVAFFERCGFQRAGLTQPMWIFAGTEH